MIRPYTSGRKPQLRPNPEGELLKSPPLPPNEELAAQKFRAKGVDTSAPPNLRREMLGELALPADFDTPGPGLR